MLLEAFDHPHWVKLGVYSKVCPLLTRECFRTGTTFFKAMVENVSRGCRIMGLSTVVLLLFHVVVVFRSVFPQCVEF